MPRIALTEKQADMLCAILYSYVSDLRLEIADTERKSWRDRMKEEEGFIMQLIDQLKTSSPQQRNDTQETRQTLQ